MAGKTQLTPNDVRDIASKHLNLGNEITSEQNKLRGQMNTMTSINKGQMWSTLPGVYEDWNAKMTDIVHQLEDMATALRSVADLLQSADEKNASGIHA